MRGTVSQTDIFHKTAGNGNTILVSEFMGLNQSLVLEISLNLSLSGGYLGKSVINYVGFGPITLFGIGVSR